MAFHMRKLPRVSFSWGGDPKVTSWVVLDDGTEVEDMEVWVDSALMVLAVEWVGLDMIARWNF